MDASSFLLGLVVGVLAGLIVGPLLRAAIAASEYRRASREAGLTDELLRRITDESEDRPSGTGPR